MKNTSWIQWRPGSGRIAPSLDWSGKLPVCAAVFIPASCPSSALWYWLSLLSVFLSRSIWQEHTHFFRFFAPYSVSLFVPSVHYSVNRCLVTLGVFTVFFLSIDSDFGGNTHLSWTELSWVVAYLILKVCLSLFCKEAPIPTNTLGTTCVWGWGETSWKGLHCLNGVLVLPTWEALHWLRTSLWFIFFNLSLMRTVLWVISCWYFFI